MISLVDRIIRIWRSREDTILTDAIIHPSNVIEMHFEKPTMNYNPGQYLYLNIPEISKYEWHPFTITSAPHEGFISVHIKVVGDWTESVLEIIKKSNIPRALIDGPYGAPVQDLLHYKVSILISAGIGGTPASGILKSVYHAYQRKAPIKLENLYFIWVCRDLQDLNWFRNELHRIETLSSDSFIECSIFITGNLDISDIHNIILDQFDKPLNQELGHVTYYGRPIWNDILKKIMNSLKPQCKRTKVGVFFCGPRSLEMVLKDQISKVSTYETEFVLHSEQF